MGFLTPKSLPKTPPVSDVKDAEVFNTFKSSGLASPMPGSFDGNTGWNGMASTADLEMWRKRHDEAIARGEDPRVLSLHFTCLMVHGAKAVQDMRLLLYIYANTYLIPEQWRKDRDAKSAARKEKFKGLFGMGSHKSVSKLPAKVLDNQSIDGSVDGIIR
ncbi:hypothetical protein MMC19_007039 [Ptychographa xylographoides]|nr:hypothetical protein [Ptychographa xylographoides]